MPTISFNLSAPHATELASSLGKHKGYQDEAGAPRPATLAEVKEYFMEEAVKLVRMVKRAEYVPTDITPT